MGIPSKTRSVPDSELPYETVLNPGFLVMKDELAINARIDLHEELSFTENDPHLT